MGLSDAGVDSGELPDGDEDSSTVAVPLTPGIFPGLEGFYRETMEARYERLAKEPERWVVRRKAMGRSGKGWRKWLS